MLTRWRCSVALLFEIVCSCYRTKVSELVKSGLILVDLRARITSELYGDAVWRFSLPPRPVGKPAARPATAAIATTAAAPMPLPTAGGSTQGTMICK